MKNKNYEFVKLPSKGKCYPVNSPLRNGKIKVSYLTAVDEDIINDSKMYKNGKLIQTILERKIVDKNIDVQTLCQGDIDAIVLWLRRTGYGDDFPVTIRKINDNEEEFTTNINLSKVKNRDFDLISDENGFFMYFMKNGDIIKYKYLSVKEIKEIAEKFRTDGLEDNYKSLSYLTLKYSTMSINGNDNKDFINWYINNMYLDELYFYSSFITDNEPKVDSNIEITNPKGQKTHVRLLFDEAIFLNIE